MLDTNKQKCKKYSHCRKSKEKLAPSSDSRKAFLGIVFLAADATAHDFDLRNPSTKSFLASELDMACRMATGHVE